MFEAAKREEEARAKRVAEEEERLRAQQEAIEKEAARRHRQAAPFENLRASLWRLANEDEWQQLVEKEKPEHDLSSFSAQSQSSPQRQTAGVEAGGRMQKNIEGAPSEESLLLQAPTPGPLNFSVDHDPLEPPVGASFCFDGTAVRLLFDEEDRLLKEGPTSKRPVEEEITEKEVLSSSYAALRREDESKEGPARKRPVEEEITDKEFLSSSYPALRRGG